MKLKMTLQTLGSLLLFAACATACSTSSSIPLGPDADSDASANDASASDGAQIALPAWSLEDVQPASARAGQTYGLSAFTEHTVVVALMEGH